MSDNTAKSKRKTTAKKRRPAKPKPSISKINELEQRIRELQDEVNELKPAPSMGRPSKRSNKMEDEIFTVLRLGLSYRTAARYVKIDETTLRAWRDEDKDFSLACEKARADPEVYSGTKLVEKVKHGNLTAIIFWLKSRTEEFQEKKYQIYQDGGEFNKDETFL